MLSFTLRRPLQEIFFPIVDSNSRSGNADNLQFTSRLVDFRLADGRRGAPFSPLSLRCNSLENSTSLSGLPSLAACSATRCQALTGSNSRSTRSEEHTSELQSLTNLVCRLLLEK